MYDVCHINGTWESKKVGRSRLYMSLASQKVEDHLLREELTPLDTMIFYFTLLRVVQGKKLK